ncbi:hypothetical protein ACJQT3_004948, partial [Escherichia coli]
KNHIYQVVYPCLRSKILVRSIRKENCHCLPPSEPTKIPLRGLSVGSPVGQPFTASKTSFDTVQRFDKSRSSFAF